MNKGRSVAIVRDFAWTVDGDMLVVPNPCPHRHRLRVVETPLSLPSSSQTNLIKRARKEM